MITELRRRAYLNAMQVANWLPRVALPFAAPSRPELLVAPEPEPESVAVAPQAEPVAAAPAVVEPVAPSVSERPKIEVPRPATRVEAKAEPAANETEAPAAPVKAAAVPPPRFSLQLLRAGSCVILAELATGEPFASRDPAYLLLKDMLRAAGLPDSPQILGEPVRWPLLARGNMDQGPQAALEYVQGFLMARLEEAEACTC
ncbi:MAG: energy transducer TonB, partial [Pseudomonas sp.]